MDQIKKIGSISTKEEFEYIIMGGAFLGSGGGGPIAAGEQIMQDVLAHQTPINIISVDEISGKSDKYGAVVAFMGSPSAGEHGIDLETPTNAFNALCNFKPLSYAMLIEIGAGNSMVPMSVAVRKNIPVLDGDGAGRAVPKIQNTTYAQVATPSPAALSNGKQPNLPTIDNVILLHDLEQDKMADALEAYCLQLMESPMFGQMGGLATYMINGDNIDQAVIPNTLAFSYVIGQMIYNAISVENDPREEVKNYLINIGLSCYTFDNAVITQITAPAEGADLDVGTVTLKDSFGNTMILNYENENLFATLNGEIWAMAPDLICYLGSKGAKSNVEIQVGDELSIFGVSANPKLRTTSIISSFMQELSALKIYEGEYIPIEKLHSK